MTLVSFGFFLLLFVVIGLLSVLKREQTGEDYLLASQSVKPWLVGKGVQGAQLATAGLGDTKPVGDNKTDAGRAANRRVELVKL